MTLNPAAAQITEWMRLFLAPGQVTELRCLPPDHNGKKVSGYFDAEHVAELAREAAWYDSTSEFSGIYFIPNPLKPTVLKRRQNRAAETGKDHAKDKDVLARRWLYLDVDPDRDIDHKDDSATDAEREAARVVLNSAIDLLASFDWPAPLIVDSGNGFHAYYPLTDADALGDVPAILRTLATACDTPFARIDTRVGNPSRLMKVPGTTARKGTPTPDRPHRLCRVISVPEGWPSHGPNHLDDRANT